MRTLAADIVSVFKLRIGVAITLTALVGLVVTPGPAVPAWKALLLALCVLASSGSAGAFNQIIERGLDARMARTRDRPFVRGAFRAGPAWYIGILLLLVFPVGASAVCLGGFAALYIFLGAFVYGVVYTVWLKPRSTLNIVVGGLAGSFAVLAGSAVIDPSPSALPLLFALALFLWTPPHFWSLAMAARADYARAGVPMLPVVLGDRTTARVILAHAVALVAVSLLPAMHGMGPVYLTFAVSGGLYFLWKSVLLVRAPTRATAMANFHGSLVQLGLMLAGGLLGHAFAL
ncbi:MAG TPA: heme o synthase [Acetobacteraceae bacterium]|jgi:protoheme IX farnesyltransferase